MWRFLILYNSKDDFFDFKVLPRSQDISGADVVYQGLDRMTREDAVADMREIYTALNSIDRWRRSDALC